MNILGISGFDGSVEFKKAHWPDLSEREHRIVQGLDSAAALFSDGELIAAAAEERFNRCKHSGAFPSGAIDYCLRQAGLDLDDIDEVAHSFDYGPHKLAYTLDPTTAALYRDVLSPEAVSKTVSNQLGEVGAKLYHVDHHLAHAASAYFCSGWEQCLVVVIDGMGERYAASVYRAEDGRLQRLAAIPARDSIGILYSLVTYHLGFDFNSDEYKVMGLAPYGDPKRFEAFFDKALSLNADGTISIPILHCNQTREERESYRATRQYLERALIKSRGPEEEITGDHEDVAAALQQCLEKAIIHICTSFGRQTGLRRLAWAGGVALNCTTNGRLVHSKEFDQVFVQPAAGDDGSAVGAAAWRASQNGEIYNRRIPTPFFGPEYSDRDVEKALDEWTDHIQLVRFDSLADTCESAARLIATGHVVAWYRGRMEFGPRALGHRSILADPGDARMRERVNAMVKMREAFRPFAPAVTLREASRWFAVENGTELPYMIATADVREAYRRLLSAVTHVDGSARLQTVSPCDNRGFHTLLEAVGRRTGREVVLNTSFNVRGQPIVNTPQQAIKTYLGCGLDYLFLNNTLVKRRETSPIGCSLGITGSETEQQLERLRHV